MHIGRIKSGVLENRRAALCQTLHLTLAAQVLFFVLIALLEVFHIRGSQVVEPALGHWADALSEELYVLSIGNQDFHFSMNS